MGKVVVGLVLGLVIGAACRFFDIPVPSPPKLVGALLVLSMTIGYVTADRLLGPRTAGDGTAASPDRPGGIHPDAR
jgi:XapX domain-containing protein